MTLNYDEQVEFLKSVRDTVTKIENEIPHLESWTEAKGYLEGSISTLISMGQLLPKDLYEDLVEYLNAEKKMTNATIDSLAKKRLL